MILSTSLVDLEVSLFRATSRRNSSCRNGRTSPDESFKYKMTHLDLNMYFGRIVQRRCSFIKNIILLHAYNRIHPQNDMNSLQTLTTVSSSANLRARGNSRDLACSQPGTPLTHSKPRPSRPNAADICGQRKDPVEDKSLKSNVTIGKLESELEQPTLLSVIYNQVKCGAHHNEIVARSPPAEVLKSSSVF